MRTTSPDSIIASGTAYPTTWPPCKPIHRSTDRKATKDMADDRTPTSTELGTTGEDQVTQACVNIDAAARQLQAAAGADVYSPRLALAGQLTLIRGGLDPTVRAAADPNDHLTPIAHVDRALLLLCSVPPPSGPDDLLVWIQRLQDLQDTLLTGGLGQP